MRIVINRYCLKCDTEEQYNQAMIDAGWADAEGNYIASMSRSVRTHGDFWMKTHGTENVPNQHTGELELRPKRVYCEGFHFDITVIGDETIPEALSQYLLDPQPATPYFTY